jgi:hypothetical protein
MAAYTINKDVKYGFLNVIDVNRISADVKEEWFNQTLCPVNDCVVRLGVVQGEFHWHHHDREDSLGRPVARFCGRRHGPPGPPDQSLEVRQQFLELARQWPAQWADLLAERGR